MSVSAIIVSRGDVALNEIVKSLRLTEPVDDIVIWDNSKRDDLSVYGRYAAIAEAKHPLIFVQDDDCVLPPASVEEIVWQSDSGSAEYGRLVVNMPANFRAVSFYAEHALIGFGSCFHRDLPERAFARAVIPDQPGDSGGPTVLKNLVSPSFDRTCDIVFTTLTPYTMVDVPYEDLPWATADNRMWKQPQHREERQRMLDLALQVRDA